MRSLPEKKSKQVLWYVSLMLGKRRTISYSYQWWLAIVESKRKKHLQHSWMFSTDRPQSLSPGHLSLDQFATDNWLALYKSYYPFVMTRVNSWFKNQCSLNDLMKLSWWFKRLQSKWWRTKTSLGHHHARVYHLPPIYPPLQCVESRIPDIASLLTQMTHMTAKVLRHQKLAHVLLLICFWKKWRGFKDWKLIQDWNDLNSP